jgi:predicted ATP-dependent endonuclease of OLD family
VSLNIETEDQFGTRVPLSSRGQGVRRLLMVAFLKFMAERETTKPMIYAIEEPETSLHPKAQRDLIESFRKLKEKGSQVVLTSHSPVFAVEVGREDVILVTRGSSQANVSQGDQVSEEEIVEELGILPRDIVAGYAACVFVEGPGDQCFLEAICKTLCEAGKTRSDLRTNKIGIVPVGGDNLRFFVEKEMVLKRLNRHFAVIVDSDKAHANDQVSQKVMRWKEKCENEGGKFFILRKRAIENYLHPAAVQRALGRAVNVEDFNDVKSQISTDYDWNRHLKPVIEATTAEEALEMDRYVDGEEKHEFLEIIEKLLQLPGT